MRLYLSSLNKTVPNFSMVTQRDILQAGDNDLNNGIENSTVAGLWCQNDDASGAAIIHWLFPNTSEVPSIMTDGPLQAVHLPGQLGLQWTNGSSGAALAAVNGMYTCIVHNEETVTQLVIWIGSDEVYDGLGINRRFY